MFSPFLLAANNKQNKEAYKAQNTKPNTSSETDKKAAAPEVPVSAVEVSKEPVDKVAKEDDKKKSAAQVLTTEATAPVVPTTKAPTATTTRMPTVVASNADTTKLNTLPDSPVVAEAKVTVTAAAPSAVVSEPAKKVEEAAVAVAKPAVSAPVVDCWTPENKDAKKRYNRDFLLSLKDKKLSKAFPDVLKDFEMAVMEQLVSRFNSAYLLTFPDECIH